MSKAVFFDLDGTLLGMDMETFIKHYLKELAAYAVPMGYEPKEIVDAMWKCTAEMVRNDGSCSNYDRFWRAFAELCGERVYDDIPAFNKFYSNEFHGVRGSCTPDGAAARAAVAAAREWADVVVLSTNPLFPYDAVATRLSWVGLSMEDFDLVTTYENATLCKPNPAYYHEIMGKLNLKAEDILMVGNDMQEDMLASEKAGILRRYFVTDWAINRDDTPVTMPCGSLRDFPAWLKKQ
ncbi:MAG: HAD family hydrolase [Oscillospiraceae bacterium]|nr:HAD family hydrolase [Oscillospiraceae bacterium]